MVTSEGHNTSEGWTGSVLGTEYPACRRPDCHGAPETLLANLRTPPQSVEQRETTPTPTLSGQSQECSSLLLLFHAIITKAISSAPMNPHRQQNARGSPRTRPPSPVFPLPSPLLYPNRQTSRLVRSLFSRRIPRCTEPR